MKNILIIVICFHLGILRAQELNYCKYFYLDVSETESKGKTIQLYSPEINLDGDDKFSSFLKKHDNRFNYLLLNKIADLDRIAAIFPDTMKLNDEFCRSLSDNKNIVNYFKNLTPRSLTTWEQKEVLFSIDEMMMVASRYFYVDKVNEKDTTLISHICVGIHGQNEIGSSSDLTLLEAFTFEGIFYYLLKDSPPLFERNFDDYLKHSLEMNKRKFTTFEILLNAVRNECYTEMYQNDDLKRKLVKYYKRNKNNLNFELKINGS
ncbi:MAG TPA: hypothetical protein VFG10_16000 [Saprospiraceae bacterium]|nr:hypothetical protein [Saprospiraceae bacterium]